MVDVGMPSDLDGVLIYSFDLKSMKRTRKNKKTAAQLAQQKRFALAVSFLSPLKEIIAEGFKAVARRKKRFVYPFNLAMSQVLRVAITDTSGEPTIDPEKVWLSDGNLPGLIVKDILKENARLTVHFVNRSDFSSWDDHVKMIAYQVDEGVAIRSRELALRHQERVVIDIPPSLLERPLLLYLTCHDRDGIKYARSQYLGKYEFN